MIAQPYADMARQYLPEWSPIPIITKAGNKVPLSCTKGYAAGYNTAYADDLMVGEWLNDDRVKRAGIALRLPKDVIGLDVDCYDGKAGRKTLAALQYKWGRLPPTWMTSSRLDGSGIRLFRVPPEFASSVDMWRDPRGVFTADGSPWGGLELLRYCHRYATVYPTLHGRPGRPMYLWFDPDGRADKENPVWPLPPDLPLLHEGWCVNLNSATGNYNLPLTAMPPGMGPGDWLKARPGGEAPACAVMAATLARYIAEVVSTGRAGGCYPAALRGTLAVIGNAAEGHWGGYPAARTLWDAYTKALGRRERAQSRPLDAQLFEFTKAMRGAIEKLQPEKFSNSDPCLGY